MTPDVVFVVSLESTGSIQNLSARVNSFGKGESLDRLWLIALIEQRLPGCLSQSFLLGWLL
jgi:hypothetical protein